MKKAALSISMVAAVGLIGGAALAATDGTLGLTSTGTVDINIPVGNVVQISGLTDFNIPVWSPGDPDVELFQNVCIYANNAGGDYQVTTDSLNNGGSGTYRLFDGGLGYLVYRVGWADSIGRNFTAPQTVEQSAGAISGNQDNGHMTSPDCVGGTALTSSLSILIEATNLGAAADGVYADTLTIVVSPN